MRSLHRNAPGVLELLLTESGFVKIELRAMTIPLSQPSAGHALQMMTEALGAYRAVSSDCSEAVRAAAWAEVAEILQGFETDSGFETTAEVLVAAGRKPA